MEDTLEKEGMSKILPKADIENQEELVDHQKMNKKSNHWFIVLIVVFIFIFLIVGLFIGSFILKSKDKPRKSIDVQSVKNQLKVEFYESKITGFPFSLKIPGKNPLTPDLIYTPFKLNITPTSIPASNSFAFDSETFKTNYERTIKIGAGMDMNKDSDKEVIGSSLKQIDFSAEFADYQNSKKVRQAVWLNYQKEKLTIDPDKDILKQSYLNDLKEILDEEIEKDKKKEQLIRFFDKYGYYIPTQIGIGGKLSFTFDETSEETARKIAGEIKADIGKIAPSANGTYSKNISTYGADISVRYIGGGDIFVDDFEKISNWFNTITKENSAPIEFYLVEPIHKYFPDDIYESFKEYKNEIDEQFGIAYEKYQLMMDFADSHVNVNREMETQAHRTYYYGATDPTYNKFIHVFTDSSIYYDVGWDTAEQEYIKSFKSTEIIIGFAITQKNNWDITSGYYTILKNPILSNTLKIKFKSAWAQDMNWGVNVYYIKWDTLD